MSTVVLATDCDTFLERLLRGWAASGPAEVAVVEVGETTCTTVTRRQLVERAGTTAGALRSAGVGSDSLVVVGAANDAATLDVCIGAWLVGATVVLGDPALDRSVLRRRVRASPWSKRPHVMSADIASGVAQPPVDDLWTQTGFPEPAVLLATGGSTGLPRLVPGPVSLDQAMFESYALLLKRANWKPEHRQLVSGPLFHAAPLLHALVGLVMGNSLVCLRRFDPRRFREALVEHSVEWCQLTPYQMLRIVSVRDLEAEDLASLRGLLHTAAPCPPWLKQKWIELLGPDRIFELYSSTEAIGVTLASGTEWLERPGTVGRGFATRLRIVGDDGLPVGPGEVGVVYMRSSRDLALRHLAAAGLVQPTPDGYATVGDRGYLDPEGYLYLAGRLDDVVNVGGTKVALSEVEAVLASHPAVVDIAVLGTPSRRVGHRLMAWVQLNETCEARQLRAWCSDRLPGAACPAIRVVSGIPRTAAGKLDRAAMVGAR